MFYTVGKVYFSLSVEASYVYLFTFSDISRDFLGIPGMPGVWGGNPWKLKRV